MAQENKRGEAQPDALADDAALLKKRARRRLIGAVALAMLAAIILPMVMDHQPAPPLKDIQVRIPSPDEGVTQRVTPRQVAKPLKGKDEKLASEHVAEPVAVAKEETLPPAKPIAKPEPVKPETKSVPPVDAKVENKVEAKPAVKVETKPEAKAELKVEAKNDVGAEGKPPAGEFWEVQLGAYQEPGRVKLLVGKLKELGIPTYTEKVDTPGGQRTRVRAGPFPSQEAAEKARVRVKIVGVDGPVARKP